MMPQQYCLRWKYHHSNLQNMFSQLLDRGCFCDVTLACEGQTLKAHRVVLCACSTYFDSILTNCSTEKDPIIIMKDCKFADVKCLIEFMYKGEINVEHNNLASLLKTAEELRIKGLAEVSWRDEEGTDEVEKRTRLSTNNNNDAQSPAPAGNNTKTIPVPLLAPLSSPQPIENGSPVPPVKKKRGRPPLDGEFDSYNTPKIAHVESSAPYSDSSNLVSVMLDENSGDHNSNSKVDDSWDDQNLEIQMDYEEELSSTRLIPKLERPDTPPDPDYIKTDPDFKYDAPESPTDIGASTSDYLTPQEQEEWKDVIKMNDYLTKGRRPQFWEEPFTKRVMEAIKTKDLEMKKAAQLLGVSYGTLYGRYRETYGCLKHPYRGPFMVSRYRDLWTEQGPAEIIGMLQRGVITLPRAAELMNTSPSSISGLLDQVHINKISIIITWVISIIVNSEFVSQLWVFPCLIVMQWFMVF